MFFAIVVFKFSSTTFNVMNHKSISWYLSGSSAQRQKDGSMMIVMKMMVMVKRMAQFLQEALSQHLSCQQRRLFAARAQSGSLVRALGRTLSRPTQGRDDASDENVSSIYICFVLYLYLYLHLESPEADIFILCLYFFCICICIYCSSPGRSTLAVLFIRQTMFAAPQGRPSHLFGIRYC